MTTRHLDLGCGAAPRNPFGHYEVHAIDIVLRDGFEPGGVHFKQANLVIDPIPYPDCHFDSVSAYDFLEHIPRVLYVGTTTVLPFVQLMSEIHRVLKPGGELYALTPCFPKEGAFADPTHVNFVTRNTYKYFSAPYSWARMYGFAGEFRPLRVQVVNFDFETKHRPLTRQIALSLFHFIYPKAKQHIVWHLQRPLNDRHDSTWRR